MKTKEKESNKLQLIGAAAYKNITEVVQRLRKSINDDDKTEKIKQEIQESVLEVSTRNGWHSPYDKDVEVEKEYLILLSAGGPATRIIGTLNAYAEPETAILQAQDWFTEWEDFRAADEDILLEFAWCFYFLE